MPKEDKSEHAINPSFNEALNRTIKESFETNATNNNTDDNMSGGEFEEWVKTGKVKPIYPVHKVENGMEQYDPRDTLSYLEILSVFIRNSHAFHSYSDVLNEFGECCLTDVTDTLAIKWMQAITPFGIPPSKGYLERSFQFIDNSKRRGILETHFYKDNLVNVRCQLFFHGWFKGTQAKEFLESELYQWISGFLHSFGYLDRQTNMMCWKAPNNYIVSTRCPPKTGSVSSYIIVDKKFCIY